MSARSKWLGAALVLAVLAMAMSYARSTHQLNLPPVVPTNGSLPSTMSLGRRLITSITNYASRTLNKLTPLNLTPMSPPMLMPSTTPSAHVPVQPIEENVLASIEPNLDTKQYEMKLYFSRDIKVREWMFRSQRIEEWM